MTFSSVVRAIASSPLLEELALQLERKSSLSLGGLARLPKGLVSSAIAQSKNAAICIVTHTLEEAGRWAVQLEAMGWQTVHFYPTTEALVYDQMPPEPEVVWAQMQVLADLMVDHLKPLAIVATVRALQVHLPSPDHLAAACGDLQVGQQIDLDQLAAKLTSLGYERTALVETEGHWSRRGDIFDLFPVASELPVRLDCFGDQIEKLREFDPASQRAGESLTSCRITPVNYSYLWDGVQEFAVHPRSESSLLDYLPPNCLVVIDELEQCRIYSDRAYEAAELSWQGLDRQLWQNPLHAPFAHCLEQIQAKYRYLQVSELTEVGIDLASRPLPVVPHQFGNLAKLIREYRGNSYRLVIVSAQPSRAVSLLQEHDCAAQFVPNPQDFPAIEKLHTGRTPVALKYSGLAEIQGFILPTFRLLLVSDREFFGQHSLGTPSYIRKRRRGNAKTIDPNKLSAGDYVVHKHQGIGQFLKLETLTIGG
ncbi:MAG: transcription-repair coupling factor, partial [Pseudanabaenaceae cyanobacterium bins.68]|nr:transcription-repair coupling factor [Pseudanabaenaceae cyanobacterium bins.68]